MKKEIDTNYLPTYYFCILPINAWSTAFTSAVFCGTKAGLKEFANSVVSLGISELPLSASGGLIIVTTSGRFVSSLANIRLSWSSNSFRGSTFVGDRHVSNSERGSAVKLSVCFFLLMPMPMALPPPLPLPAPLGVLLDVRNKRERFSPKVKALPLLPLLPPPLTGVNCCCCCCNNCKRM